MSDQEQKHIVDEMLETTLQRYGDNEPLLGLERRILVRLEQHKKATWLSRFSAPTITVLATILILIVVASVVQTEWAARHGVALEIAGGESAQAQKTSVRDMDLVEPLVENMVKTNLPRGILDEDEVFTESVLYDLDAQSEFGSAVDLSIDDFSVSELSIPALGEEEAKGDQIL